MTVYIIGKTIKNIVFLASLCAKYKGSSLTKVKLSKQLIVQCFSLLEAKFQEHIVKAQHRAGTVLYFPCNIVLEIFR